MSEFDKCSEQKQGDKQARFRIQHEMQAALSEALGTEVGLQVTTRLLTAWERMFNQLLIEKLEEVGVSDREQMRAASAKHRAPVEDG